MVTVSDLAEDERVADAESLERREHLLRLAAWLVVAPIGLLLLTQTFGLDPARPVAAAQALTPYAVLALVPVVGVALARRWWDVAGVGSAIGLGGVVLATPLVFPPGQPTPDLDATPVEVAAINLLYDNERSSEIADVLAGLDPDVVVFTEYTVEHQTRLLDHPLAEGYPHRVELDGLAAGGTAVWSRFPLVLHESPDMANYDVDVEVDGPAGPFRLWAVHPPSPLHPQWRDDLDTIGRRSGTIDAPLLVAGDFNASYWHPAFRDLLRSGLTSAHIANDRGWSMSWPTGRVFPAFVRIDHALTNERLVSTDVVDFTVPGSDHRGFVVTILPAA